MTIKGKRKGEEMWRKALPFYEKPTEDVQAERRTWRGGIATWDAEDLGHSHCHLGGKSSPGTVRWRLLPRREAGRAAVV